MVIRGVGMATNKVAMGMVVLKRMKEELLAQLEWASDSRLYNPYKI